MFMRYFNYLLINMYSIRYSIGIQSIFLQNVFIRPHFVLLFNCYKKVNLVKNCNKLFIEYFYTK